LKNITKWGAIAAIAGSALLSAPAAFAGPDQQATVDHAIVTLQDLRHDKEFGTAKEMMRTAHAIMIAPRIFKGAFFFGGEGGSAVLMVRGPHGWSDPAFYTIGSASFGLQIGAKESELILFIRSEKALSALMRDKFKIGGDAGIAVATLGSDVQGATTANAGADIIAWASSAGAFAGISLDGSIIAPAHDADDSYYGHAVSTSRILHDAVSNPGAAGLRRALNSLS
jgi:lipid-binding SYLF domain-containing protein